MVSTIVGPATSLLLKCPRSKSIRRSFINLCFAVKGLKELGLLSPTALQ